MEPPNSLLSLVDRAWFVGNRTKCLIFVPTCDTFCRFVTREETVEQKKKRPNLKQFHLFSVADCKQKVQSWWRFFENMVALVYRANEDDEPSCIRCPPKSCECFYITQFPPCGKSESHWEKNDDNETRERTQCVDAHFPRGKILAYHHTGSHHAEKGEGGRERGWNNHVMKRASFKQPTMSKRLLQHCPGSYSPTALG